MSTHRFDPVSALLAVIAIAGGLTVVLGVAAPTTHIDRGVWVAVVALLAGLALVPWGRRQHRTDASTGTGVETGPDAGFDTE